MRIITLVSILVACTGSARTTPATTGDSGSQLAEDGTTEVLYYTLTEGECFESDSTDRPDDPWQAWMENCWGSNQVPYGTTFSTLNGECVMLVGTFEAGDRCDVVDGDWLAPCDEVVGCCEADISNKCPATTTP
jgi:hypothetical protein